MKDQIYAHFSEICINLDLPGLEQQNISLKPPIELFKLIVSKFVTTRSEHARVTYLEAAFKECGLQDFASRLCDFEVKCKEPKFELESIIPNKITNVSEVQKRGLNFKLLAKISIMGLGILFGFSVMFFFNISVIPCTNNGKSSCQCITNIETTMFKPSLLAAVACERGTQV